MKISMIVPLPPLGSKSEYINPIINIIEISTSFSFEFSLCLICDIYMNSYSFLKTRSTRKKLNAPLPNPTNKQSMNSASLEEYPTPIAVPTTIKRYMNHFSVVLISQFKTIT